MEVMEQGKRQTTISVEQSRIAAEAINTIIQYIEDIDEINTNVASASVEQNQVIDNVKKNIENILHVADEAVRYATLSSNACVQLTEQARKQQDVVDNFKI